MEKNRKFKIKWQDIVVILASFALGGVLVWIFVYSDSPQKRACGSMYSFLSKEIDCENIDEKVNHIENLHGGFQKIINEEKEARHIIRASIFYRDLNTRRWFGINDIDKFYPASLVKLPIAILYFKMAELNPSVFDQRLKIPEDIGDNSDQHYQPSNPLLPGNSYTIKEMVEHMLEYSDNAPFSTLADSAGIMREKVFSDLNVYEPPVGEENEGAWSVTARNYANIFRMLYNASYVNADSANRILSILSQSSFTNGLVAGVPKGVIVSHKFGEAAGVDRDNNVQSLILNDCGIIYKPEAPYILCVMSEGYNYPDLEKFIQRLSREAYDNNL